MTRDALLFSFMKTNDNATPTESKALLSARASGGLAWGALGVLSFSLTLPATRVAVRQLDPGIVGLGRVVVAAALAAVALGATRQPLPARAHWPRLAVVSLGVVIGFPVLSALAMAEVPASHGAVVAGLLPAATAAMAVLRVGERPPLAFWGCALLGLASVLAFAASLGTGGLQQADALLLLAVALAALGYAEGGALARELGAWQVISWALVGAAPFAAPLLAVRFAERGGSAAPGAWVAFLYVSVVSQYLGFFAWYRGLAEGGVARVGQLQLAQPILTLLWSALLLGEHLSWPTLGAAGAVLVSVFLTQQVGARPAAARRSDSAAPQRTSP